MMRFGNIPKPKPDAAAGAAAAGTARTRSPRTSTKPPLPESARRPSSVPTPIPGPGPVSAAAAAAATTSTREQQQQQQKLSHVAETRGRQQQQHPQQQQQQRPVKQHQSSSPVTATEGERKENVRPSSAVHAASQPIQQRKETLDSQRDHHHDQQLQPQTIDAAPSAPAPAALPSSASFAATTAKIAELQSLAEEWRKRRDAAQIIFMQENGAVDRLRKTLEQTNNRIAKKKQLLAQHSLALDSAHPDENNANINNTAMSSSSHVGGVATSAAGMTSSSSAAAPIVPRRDQAIQCDAALVSTIRFCNELDTSQRDNVRAMQTLRATVLDAGVRRNVQLAQEVAALVQRVQVMQQELQQQMARIRHEHSQGAPAQVAAAERLLMSINVQPFVVTTNAVDNSTGSTPSSSFVGAAGEAFDPNLMMMNGSAVSIAGVDATAHFHNHHPETVYRTVEKCRLALAQCLVSL